VDDDVRVDVLPARRAGEAGRVLAASHAQYPAFRHLLPDEWQRQRVLWPFMTATARDAARYGRCCAASEGRDVLAVALWMPPGAWPLSPLRKLRMAPALLVVMAAAGRRAADWARTGSALEKHAGEERAWYLEAMGVRPAAQRRGLGRRLLVPILDEADAQGVACRLHTSDQANVSYYERFGFAVVDPLRPVFPGGPAYLAMRRPPHANG
jgi:ribosomal protein S18 acetylase RimI-like enzyme